MSYHAVVGLASRVGWRIASAIAVVWIVVTAAFFLQSLVPSDPARAIAGPQARASDVAAIRTQLGLDKPLATQYIQYVRRVCSGDFGTSFQRSVPVNDLVKQHLPNTLMLGGTAIGLQLVLGTLAGLIAALRKGTWLDHLTITASLIGISAPTFLTGLLLQYWFAYRFSWLPFDGFGTTLRQQLISMILPAITLGLFGAAYFARYVRDEMITILRQDYIRTAIAKGLPPTRVLFHHALRNAMMPLITIIGMDIGAMFGGAVVTEKLFRWPGIGSLMVDAVIAKDTPVVMGIVVMTSLAVVGLNLIVDLTYAFVDPRTNQKSLRYKDN